MKLGLLRSALGSKRTTFPSLQRRLRLGLSRFRDSPGAVSLCVPKATDGNRSKMPFTKASGCHQSRDPLLVLFFSSLLPEPSSSAAGIRTLSLLKGFLRADRTVSIHYATSSKLKLKTNEKTPNVVSNSVMDDLKEVQFHYVPPNNSQATRDFLELAVHINSCSTDTEVLVLFDRFYSEEAYSFHVHKFLPDSTLVLDMQDMHSLRLGRHDFLKRDLVESSRGASDRRRDPLRSLSAMKQHYRPSINDEDSSRLLRELASIHRSDLTLVCSPYEYKLLKDTYDVPESKLSMASFFVESDPGLQQLLPPHCERTDFVFVGGFRHAPNLDAVQVLARDLWPAIRQRLPSARLYIYGSYMPHTIQKELNDSGNGLIMRGYVSDLDTALCDKRVLLAPLRFGAGIKGKIVDAWRCGVPVVTTPIGSEGMTRTMNGSGKDQWGGLVASSADAFVEGAVQLYKDSGQWRDCQKRGFELLSELYCAKRNWLKVESDLKGAVTNRAQRRSRDYTRAMFWHQSVRSTEYFSRWLECKETSKDR